MGSCSVYYIAKGAYLLVFVYAFPQNQYTISLIFAEHFSTHSSKCCHYRPRSGEIMHLVASVRLSVCPSVRLSVFLFVECSKEQ